MTLVTGCVGLAGIYACQRFLRAGCVVVGFDDPNDHDDTALVRGRLQGRQGSAGVRFHQLEKSA